MSGGNDPCFSWLSFLIGLAIGLWIAVVALFLLDDGDDCDCGPGGTTVITQPVGGEAWIPAGDANYYCTNDDQGRAIVVDQGRAVVVDQGSAIVVDQGGAIVVDSGAGNVSDPGPHSPAPASRSFEEFACDSNDQGGAIVVDRNERRVMVPMPVPANPDNFVIGNCGKLNGNAVVKNNDGKEVLVKSNGQAHTEQLIEFETSATTQLDIDVTAKSSTNLRYCYVESPDADPVVLKVDIP